MPRLTIALIALVGILAGGLGTTLLNRPLPQIDAVAVRAIVAEVLEERAQVAAAKPAAPIAPVVPNLDPSVLNPMIETYLMADPSILRRMSEALEKQTRTAEAEVAKTALASIHDTVFEDQDQVVLGNPKGDVTLVEMFDYNCGFCRSSMPDLAALIAEDPNLRIVLKEFPILSEGSLDAAKVAVLVNKAGVDYWAFHEAMFTGRGQNDMASAMAAAQSLGLDPMTLKLDLAGPAVGRAIQTSYDIAKALNISSTPTYIIGNEIIPGAVGVDALRERIANVRACGESQCDG